MPIRCLLIGEENLLVECAQILLARQHIISGVVSTVVSIQAWCEQHNIPCFATIRDFSESTNAKVDYLFSIVNGKILSSSDLAVAVEGAINYHDSILPRYAGVNATTWSIYNNEVEHGITWHMINEGIDTGDIVYQNRFPISQNETALTLNLKCFQEAISGFQSIINDIESNTLSAIPQTAENRSYYGLTHVLPNLGFVDWNTTSAEQLERHVRSVNFGGYKNGVGTMKLFLDDQFWIIKSVTILNEPCSETTGRVLHVTETGLTVSTLTHPVHLEFSISSSGKPITNTIFNQRFTEGAQLPPLPNQICQTHKDYALALKKELHWLDKLSQQGEHAIFNDKIFERNSNSTLLKLCLNEPAKFYMAGILIYLFRISDYEQFSFYMINENLSLNSKHSGGLLSSLLPSNSFIEAENDGKICLEKIESFLSANTENGTYLTDIFVRHPSLNIPENDCFISIAISGPELQPPENSILHFAIDENNGTLEIRHQIDIKYQGGVLQPILNNMSEHITNIIKNIKNNPDKKISSFTFLTNEEKSDILTWSTGEFHQLPSHNLVERISANARSFLYEAAICDENSAINYEELLSSAENISHNISGLLDNRNEPIGLHSTINPKSVPVILGIISAGYICHPVSPGHEVSTTHGFRQLITSKATLDEFTENFSAVPQNALHDINMLFEPCAKKLPNVVASQSPALQLEQVYTHKNLINISFWLAKKMLLKHGDRIFISGETDINKASLILVCSLMYGATVYTYSEALNSEQLHSYIQETEATHALITTAEYKELLRFAKIDKLGIIILDNFSEEAVSSPYTCLSIS